MFPDSKVDLIPGSGGAFEVQVEGRLVFSKLKLRRFPAYREIPDLLGE